jgi:hypothetical protein
MSDQEVPDLSTDIIVNCPHCDKPVLIEKLNCCIFRHAILKTTGQQINPHSSKEECDQLVKTDQIFGCGRPFKISIKLKLSTNEIEYICEECDYI